MVGKATLTTEQKKLIDQFKTDVLSKTKKDIAGALKTFFDKNKVDETKYVLAAKDSNQKTLIDALARFSDDDKVLKAIKSSNLDLYNAIITSGTAGFGRTLAHVLTVNYTDKKKAALEMVIKDLEAIFKLDVSDKHQDTVFKLIAAKEEGSKELFEMVLSFLKLDTQILVLGYEDAGQKTLYQYLVSEEKTDLLKHIDSKMSPIQLISLETKLNSKKASAIDYRFAVTMSEKSVNSYLESFKVGDKLKFADSAALLTHLNSLGVLDKLVGYISSKNTDGTSKFDLTAGMDSLLQKLGKDNAITFLGKSINSFDKTGSAKTKLPNVVLQKLGEDSNTIKESVLACNGATSSLAAQAQILIMQGYKSEFQYFNFDSSTIVSECSAKQVAQKGLEDEAAKQFKEKADKLILVNKHLKGAKKLEDLNKKYANLKLPESCTEGDSDINLANVKNLEGYKRGGDCYAKQDLIDTINSYKSDVAGAVKDNLVCIEDGSLVNSCEPAFTAVANAQGENDVPLNVATYARAIKGSEQSEINHEMVIAPGSLEHLKGVKAQNVQAVATKLDMSNPDTQTLVAVTSEYTKQQSTFCTDNSGFSSDPLYVQLKCAGGDASSAVEVNAAAQ